MAHCQVRRAIRPKEVILSCLDLARSCKWTGVLRTMSGLTRKGCVFLNTAKSPSVWALAKLCNGAGIGILQYVGPRQLWLSYAKNVGSYARSMSWRSPQIVFEVVSLSFKLSGESRVYLGRLSCCNI